MLTKILDEHLIQKAKHLLSPADRVVIISHVGPDGDAMGSSLALADFLKTGKKEVQVLYPDRMPGFLKWLPGADKALTFEENPEACRQYVEQAQVIVFLDFNQRKRMGGLSDCLEGSKAKTILMDHHPNPEQFADVTLSYPQISSTCEIVFRYICRTGAFDEMSTSCATCVYTGMMTDTGAFTYNSSNEELFYIISQLIRKGVEKDEVFDKVYNTYSVGRMRLMGFVLYECMKIREACGAAIITLSKADIERFDYQIGDTEGFVNLPLSIEGIRLSVFLREDVDKIKLSFRSKGSLACNKLAAEYFNGGGHLNAAGGEYYGSLNDAVKRLEEALTSLNQPALNDKGKQA